MITDLKRMAYDYVRRQVRYMNILPTAAEIERATRKVHQALLEIRRAHRVAR